MGKPNKRQVARKRRHARVRKQLEGTSERPRLNGYLHSTRHSERVWRARPKPNRRLR